MRDICILHNYINYGVYREKNTKKRDGQMLLFLLDKNVRVIRECLRYRYWNNIQVCLIVLYYWLFVRANKALGESAVLVRSLAAQVDRLAQNSGITIYLNQLTSIYSFIPFIEGEAFSQTHTVCRSVLCISKLLGPVWVFKVEIEQLRAVYECKKGCKSPLLRYVFKFC